MNLFKKNKLKWVVLCMTLLMASALFARSKDPIVIEVMTRHTSVNEALQAAKSALLAEKFIAANGMQETSFTATRTTGSKADYYVADVTAAKTDGKIKLTISFVKVGTGLLGLKKVAASVKSKLEQ